MLEENRQGLRSSAKRDRGLGGYRGVSAFFLLVPFFFSFLCFPVLVFSFFFLALRLKRGGDGPEEGDGK